MWKDEGNKYVYLDGNRCTLNGAHLCKEGAREGVHSLHITGFLRNVPSPLQQRGRGNNVGEGPTRRA